MPARQYLHVGVVSGVVRSRKTSPNQLFVALVGGLPRLTLAQLGFRGGDFRGAGEGGVELDRHRLLAPQRPVVVEHGHPFLDGHRRRSALATRTRRRNR